MVLPQPELPPRAKTEAATELGTLCHYYVETGEEEPEWASKADIRTLQKKVALSGINREEWWPEGEGRHEVPFALNPFTFELVEWRIPMSEPDNWKKSFDPRKWLTGTIDWLWNDGRIDDLKTGAFEVDPTTSGQLRSYSLVPWFKAGRPLVWSLRVSISWWPRYPLPGLPQRTYHTITGFDLMEHLDDIRWALEHPNEVNPSPYPDLDIPWAEREPGKLPNCAGCECRETIPASTWMQNFWHRTLPYCTAGLAKQAKKVN